MVFSQFIDEYTFSVSLTVVALIVGYFTWKLSCRLPLNYHVHLIQTYHVESQQVVEVVNVDPSSVQTEDLVSLIREERSFSENPTVPNDQRYTPRVRAFVIHSPSFIRPVELQSDSFEPGVTTIYLPLNLERHISQIYQTLQTYSDPAVAGAVVISLYRNIARRLSNQNNLYISQLLNEVGTTDTNTVNLSFSPNHDDNLSAATSSSSDSSDTATTDSSLGSEETSSESIEVIEVERTEQSGNIMSNNNAANSEIPVDMSVDGPSIKLKFLDDTERVVKANLLSTVLDFKKINFSEQVADGKVIRLIFKGQLLRDDHRSLQSYGLYENCIVHCHISSRPYAQPSTRNTTNGERQNNAEDRLGYSNVQIPVRPVFDEVNNEPWSMRILRLGVYYADMVPFVLFYALTSSINWIREVENVRSDEDLAWYYRYLNRLRRAMFAVLSFFIDFSTQQNQNPEDIFSNRFNIGVLFTLLFTVKFVSIWFVVIYFPHFADGKAIFMLLVLTIFFGLYTFQNHSRPRANRQENAGVVNS
ncbi:hypothetical protein M3Y94_00348400 [Aphelenchoides besseyi]|nr:hypothetical protein M3Y94_00348400 [Aphelenchoides besseyi]KAI6235373.1 Ubiquitin-like domain-containing protein [Aphelenchoides besseyi]